MLGTVKESRFRFRDLNFKLIIYVLLLSILGVFVVHSATAKEVTKTIVNTTVKQIIGVVMGVVLMALFAVVDYRKMTKYAWIFYVASILSLLYVRFFCDAIYGAHRWIYIPFFGTIQPSEFSKPAIIMMLAFLIYKMKDKISKVYCILLYLVLAMPVLVLVLIEPDLSTTIVLFVIVTAILYISGISYKWIVGVMIIMIPVIILFMIAVYQPGQPWLNKILEEHQVNRINGYFFPEDYPNQAWQQNASVMAIGSGGLFGKGLNNSSLESVKNGSFLSEESCDFIFAVVGEELGFIGSVVLIILVGLITVECFLTAKRCTDMAGRVIAGTVGVSFAAQSMINIGVATLLIPNTGIPLPFISAGMSSLLSSYIMTGLVLSVSLWGRLKKRVFY